MRIDGRKIGVTPLALEFAVGKHRVLLENNASGVRREVEVVVSADEARRASPRAAQMKP